VSNLTVVYDACVLYPAPLRDFLMYIAVTDLYCARWSNHIHDEWIRSVLKKRTDLSAEQLKRTRELMDSNVRDGLVTGYESLIDAVSLPDPDDRHVLAAAIRAGAHLIITFNLKDFPEKSLQPYGIEAQHPDEFLTFQFDLAPNVICRAAKTHRENLRNPHKDIEEYLATLEAQGLAQTVSRLRPFADMI
jgi:hypothetical protein